MENIRISREGKYPLFTEYIPFLMEKLSTDSLGADGNIYRRLG